MTASDREFPQLDDNLRQKIVEKTAEAVKDFYVFEDDAVAMSDVLLSKLQEDAFGQIEAIPALTKALTKALYTIREDLHLVAIAWLPPAEADGAAEGHLDRWKSGWRRRNYDFRKLEVLLGNIGYVDLRGFATADEAGPTAAAAMQFLAHTDALIFDLRDNGGGDNLVALLMSYLFDEPKHVHTARHRDHDEQTWTYAFVPGPRFTEHPVYVLISRTTFSAAEDFSYNLQQLGRATIVGEQTRGGAHPVEFYRYPELFLELMIPNAFSVNPVSGTNWEDSGVVPDIAVPADEALAVAHEKALEVLLKRAQEDEKRSLRKWALEVVRARRTPYEADAGTLAAYAGAYSSSVLVELHDEELSLSWGGRRAYPLTPISEHRFVFDHGLQRVTFSVENAKAAELLWESEDGNQWRMKRES
ncbi:S41 family peptidase [Candidatus Bipolaricaulota bacterium]|nr:S41 family peptidase [Candidatus Bipolaricaulota bacterium]